MTFKNKTLKKKKMLDLFIKKKLSTKKKRIIQTYGKDMIAEMYLDLLNLHENKKKSFNNGINMQKYSKRRNSNDVVKRNSNENFKLIDKSMFDNSQDIASNKPSRNLGLNTKSFVEELKNNSFIDRFKSRSAKSKHRSHKSDKTQSFCVN
jgi:hypothetical protein